MAWGIVCFPHSKKMWQLVMVQQLKDIRHGIPEVLDLIFIFTLKMPLLQASSSCLSHEVALPTISVKQKVFQMFPSKQTLARRMTWPFVAVRLAGEISLHAPAPAERLVHNGYGLTTLQKVLQSPWPDTWKLLPYRGFSSSALLDVNSQEDLQSC